MSRISKYESYQVEDFVDDNEFREWIIAPTEQKNAFWNHIIFEFPHQKDAVDIAQKIVSTLYFEEPKVDQSEYINSLTFLQNYLGEKSGRKSGIRKLSNSITRVAAILLLPILLVNVYFLVRPRTAQLNRQMVHFVVPYGQKSNLILGDGTKIWLNSGSELSYYPEDDQLQRKVYLKGEAFFDVTKDKHRPFFVETHGYTVKVFGTQFNLRAFDDDQDNEAILKEGSIAFLTKDNEEVMMNPGERLLLTGDKYSVTKVDPEPYLIWKDNVLKINNETLNELVIRMERWYGVKIQINDFERVKGLRYTLTIKTESLREMLELMKYVTPFDYKINGEVVTLNYNS